MTRPDAIPEWAWWTLWIVVVAVIVVAVTEWPKRHLKQHAPAVWKEAQVTVMVPLMLLTGALLGFLIYPRAGLVDDPLLAAALGGSTGPFAPAIYEGVRKLWKEAPSVLLGRLKRDPPAPAPTDPDESEADADATPRT